VSAFVHHYTVDQGVTGMSERSEEFRGKAALCERMAQQTQDPEVRREFAVLAHGWLYLAVRSERPCDVQFASRSTGDDE
jgi:hypothetical protein